MAIRFIVHTISSMRDRSGNCYHFARIVSTRTGKRLHFHADGPGNAKYLLGRVLGMDYSEQYAIETEILKTQWYAQQRMHKVELIESDVTAAMLLALEQP
jgi:hypothetical protein